MKIQFEDTDILMSEFELPADYMVSHNLPSKAGVWLQAWCDGNGSYIICLNTKAEDHVTMVNVSKDVRRSVQIFTDLVGQLGYSNEQQGEEALKALVRLMSPPF